MTTYIPLYKENSVESVPGGEVSVVLGEIKQYDNCKKINTTWSDSSKIDLKLSQLLDLVQVNIMVPHIILFLSLLTQMTQNQ